MLPVRSLVLCALVGSLGGAAGCKHDADRVAALVAAIDLLEDAQCKCVPAGDECGSGRSVGSACEQRVVHKHEKALGSWLECAIDATREQAGCVRDAACSALDQGACGADADDVCGEAPEPAARAIESDIDRLCDEDGDDEDTDSDGSSDSSGASTGSAFDAGAAQPPPPTLTPVPPPSMPMPDATVQMCVEASPMRPRINPSCVSCLCSQAVKDTIACDASCWDLLECMLTFCPDAARGSAEQMTCAVENCMDSLGGAGAATAVGATLRGACDAVCPPF